MGKAWGMRRSKVMGVKLKPLWAWPFAGSPCFSLNPSAQHLSSTHLCKSCGKN